MQAGSAMCYFIVSCCVMSVLDCAGPHPRNPLSYLLHGPAASERKTCHVSGQRRSGKNHPGV